MLPTIELVITIAVISLGTILTRIIPFILFPANRKTPPVVIYLGKVLPYSIIGMLVVYCLKETSLVSYPYGIPELLSTAFIVCVHKLRHNMLLSIGGGTVFYMLLVQLVF